MIFNGSLLNMYVKLKEQNISGGPDIYIFSIKRQDTKEENKLRNEKTLPWKQHKYADMSRVTHFCHEH